MIINGIEITKFRWNDKEVTEEEYIKLCEEHKEFVRKLEEDRAVAKSRSPWYTFAGSLFQIAIVLLSASILAVNNRLYIASIWVGGAAILLMSQAVWLWLPI